MEEVIAKHKCAICGSDTNNTVWLQPEFEIYLERERDLEKYGDIYIPVCDSCPSIEQMYEDLEDHVFEEDISFTDDRYIKNFLDRIDMDRLIDTAFDKV